MNVLTLFCLITILSMFLSLCLCVWARALEVVMKMLVKFLQLSSSLALCHPRKILSSPANPLFDRPPEFDLARGLRGFPVLRRNGAVLVSLETATVIT